jgi:hypothetical protein
VGALGRIQFFDFSPKPSPVGKFDFNFDNKSFISTQVPVTLKKLLEG